MPIETVIRLKGGPLANTTATTGSVKIGSLLRLVRPSGAIAFYKVTAVEQVPNRTSFTGSAQHVPNNKVS